MALRPTYAAASNLGTLYFGEGRYADAARAFERARELAPNDYRVWRNLGAALHWSPGEQSKAAEAYRKAVELGEEARKVNPRQPPLLAQLADAYSMLGQRAEALAAATAVERLGTTDMDAMFNLASAYEQIGERDRALQWLAKALAAGYPREAVDRIARPGGVAEGCAVRSSGGQRQPPRLRGISFPRKSSTSSARRHQRRLGRAGRHAPRRGREAGRRSYNRGCKSPQVRHGLAFVVSMACGGGRPGRLQLPHPATRRQPRRRAPPRRTGLTGRCPKSGRPTTPSPRRHAGCSISRLPATSIRW